ncbi:MAG: hypothetical protein JXA54_02335 [Candidatus Heimdallarchaeota archaeon]|nr:hypothetical protein [Candidatus Heimdallarchaeota archaeon]
MKKQSLVSSEKDKDYLSIIKNSLGLHSTDYFILFISLWARKNDLEEFLNAKLLPLANER